MSRSAGAAARPAPPPPSACGAPSPTPSAHRGRTSGSPGGRGTGASRRAAGGACGAREPVPPEAAARLVLGEEIYGAIRNYEVWLMNHQNAAGEAERAEVRRVFTAANQALSHGDLEAARARLEEATTRVRALKRGQRTRVARV